MFLCVWFAGAVKRKAEIFEKFKNPSDDAFKVCIQDELKAWKARIKAKEDREVALAV